MIERANALQIPTVNVQWINDIILGEEINVLDSNNTKYQQFDLFDPFSINCVKVSHLMGMLSMNLYFIYCTLFFVL